ncbi:unnamed protein product [Sphenostylis stenocarpa]|uniref:Uncharacterized protein n=1 Tax=Sphenostylis stenocarpa TaxID=92480 RepID=A0AA86SNA4_9FABA|nr:unnamed protein product [Sphenostylis stenocarpa]
MLVTVIFEILLRKCGSAAIKLVTPDNYKFFLKTVLENRHGKSSEAVTKDSENIPEDSSTTRPEWRKPERSTTPEKNSMKTKKRKRDNKFETDKPGQKGALKSTSNDGLSLPKRSRHSSAKNPNVRRPEKSRKGKKSGNKSFTGGGGKMTNTAKDKAASNECLSIDSAVIAERDSKKGKNTSEVNQLTIWRLIK